VEGHRGAQRLLPRWAAPRGEGGNPTGLPRFQSAWLRGITSNITASLEAKIATVAGVEIELELDPLKKIDREKQGGAW